MTAGNEALLLQDVPVITHAVNKPLRILHLEDNSADADLFRILLKAEKIECVISRAQSRREFEALLEQGPYDLIISDFCLPAFDGMTAFSFACARWPGTPFVFLSGTAPLADAQEALQRGVRAFLVKDDADGLLTLVRGIAKGS
jgi:CheY-like chemotaxis protein